MGLMHSDRDTMIGIIRGGRASHPGSETGLRFQLGLLETDDDTRGARDSEEAGQGRTRMADSSHSQEKDSNRDEQ